MRHQGLCMTCSYDLTCCFPRSAPVLYCEEFDTGRARVTGKKVGSSGCRVKCKPCATGAAESEAE